MTWILCAVAAALSWGLYGPLLHQGQQTLAHPMRALLCVGAAYFVVAILIPGGTLMSQGELRGFNMAGTAAATAAGALGALGAIFVILAFRAGGIPTYVMPLVFGGAPLVNVAYSMWAHPPKSTPNPMLWAGFALVSIGASLVLYFRPQH
jgi:drug/metabolite transporter (DMT)-like permease